MAQAQTAGLAIYDVAVKIDPHCTMPIAARQLIQNAISSVGQVLVVRPDAKSPAATKQVEFVCASSHSEEQIAAKSRIPTIAGDVSIILIAAAKPVPAAKANVAIENELTLPVIAAEDLASQVSAKRCCRRPGFCRDHPYSTCAIGATNGGGAGSCAGRRWKTSCAWMRGASTTS